MEKLSIKSKTTKENPNKTQSKWTNLPKQILTNLLKFIDLKTDLPRIRAVCPSWRNSLPLTRNLPDRLPAPSLKYNKTRLAESRFYLISPRNCNAKPWLARMLNLGPGKWHLLNPFNMEDYFESYPSVTAEINLLDFNVVEVARPWSLIGVGFVGLTDFISKKVVGGWNVESGYMFAVLVQLEVPGCGDGGELVFKRLRDQEWVRFVDDKSVRMLDIGYFDGKFYAFELTKWRVGVIDPEKSSISMEFMDAPGVPGEDIDGRFSVLIDGCSYILSMVYLVPSETRLYCVIDSSKVGSTKAILLVFVLKEGGWERVRSLGDKTLFIGYDVAFSVSNLGIWKKGSICLFTRPFPILFDVSGSRYKRALVGGECIEMMRFPRYWMHLKMYNMDEEEKGIVRFLELPIKEYTGLFFPPPAWVKWRCLLNVEVFLHNVKFTDLERFRKMLNEFGDGDNDDGGNRVGDDSDYDS